VIFRADKLLTELPVPKHPSANAASAVQELMGGKAGELSTLMNYFFQTINFRDRDNYRPYYELIANIAAEEWGHVELVASAINLLLTGTTTRGHDPTAKPLADVLDLRNTYHFFAAGQNALPIDSMGNFWNGSYVNSSGSLKLDLVHNFFLGKRSRLCHDHQDALAVGGDSGVERPQPLEVLYNPVPRLFVSPVGPELIDAFSLHLHGRVG